MKKILLVIALLMMCAALEVPEDYETAHNSPYTAKLRPAENQYAASSVMPADIGPHEKGFPL